MGLKKEFSFFKKEKLNIENGTVSEKLIKYSIDQDHQIKKYCIMVLLCVLALGGIYLDIPYSGWLIFLAFCML